MYFNTGFLPTMVIVSVQYQDASGGTDIFSYIPSCFTIWDDLFTMSLSCFYLTSLEIMVYHNGNIFGSPETYMINGSSG